MLECTNLTTDVGTTIDGSDMKTIYILSKAIEIIGNLETKLTGRTQDNGLCLLVLSISLLNDRNTIRCRLTCTRLCQGDNVVFVA